LFERFQTLKTVERLFADIGFRFAMFRYDMFFICRGRVLRAERFLFICSVSCKRLLDQRLIIGILIRGWVFPTGQVV